MSSLPSHASFGVRLSGASTKSIPAVLRSSTSAHGRDRIGGRAIDDHRARLEPRLQAVRAAHHRLDLGRAGHAEKHDRRAFADLARVRRLARAPGDEILDRLAVAPAGDDQRIAFLDDVLGHAVAHQAEADEADRFFRHETLPVALPIDFSRADSPEPPPTTNRDWSDMAIDRDEIRGVARSQMPAGDARAGARRRRHLLGRPALGVPVAGAKAVVRALPGARLHRAELAEGIWRRRAFARRGGVLREEMRRIGARPPLTSFGISMLGPALLAFGDARAEGRASAAHRARRDPLVPGLFRARRRLRPRLAQHEGRGQGRSFPRQRPEDLDLLRRQGRLDLLPGAHQPGREEAARHFLPADRHGDAGRLDQADRADLRQIAVLRDVLRQCRRSEGEPRRQARPRLGRRQISVDPRARDDRRRRLEPVRQSRARQGGGEGGAGAGSPTRSCAPRSPRPRSTPTPPTRRGGAMSTRSPAAANSARARRSSNTTAPSSTSAGTNWRWRSPAPTASISTAIAAPDVAEGWLRSKGNSIEGGTSEVMLDIVAKRLLDLPAD